MDLSLQSPKKTPRNFPKYSPQVNQGIIYGYTPWKTGREQVEKAVALAVAILGMLKAPQEKNPAKHGLTRRRLEIAAIFWIQPG